MEKKVLLHTAATPLILIFDNPIIPQDFGYLFLNHFSLAEVTLHDAKKGQNKYQNIQCTYDLILRCILSKVLYLYIFSIRKNYIMYDIVSATIKSYFKSLSKIVSYAISSHKVTDVCMYICSGCLM